MGRQDGRRPGREGLGQSVRAALSASPSEGGPPAGKHQRKWLYYKLFPNVAFDIYPDQVDFMQFLPVSGTESIIREISYGLPDDRREMKTVRYLNWRINRRVNAEDTELITRVQLGMQSSSYKAGPLGTSEVCLPELRRSSGGLPGGAAGTRRRQPAGAASPTHKQVNREAGGDQHRAPRRRLEPGAIKRPDAVNQAEDGHTGT